MITLLCGFRVTEKNDSITEERVRILYAKGIVSISTAVISAFLMVYIFTGQIETSTLIGWLGVMLLSALVRYWTIFDYFKNKDRITDHKKYENRFAYLTGIVGLIWAFFIVTALTLPTFEYRIYGLLLLTAMVALAVPIFSSSPKTIYLYIAPSLVITIPLLVFSGGNDTALGLILIVYSAAVINASKDGYKVLTDVLSLRNKTKELVTNLKRLTHEKSEAEQRMQAIMDYAPTAIFVKDLKGRFTFINKSAVVPHYTKHDDLIGKTLYDVYPPEIAERLRQNDLGVIHSGKPVEYEESIPLNNGTYHTLSIRFPLFDDSGELYAVGGVSTDITQRVHAEETLRFSQQRLLLHRKQSPMGVIEWNTDFEFLDWNPAAERIFGFTKEEVLGANITERILPEGATDVVSELWALLMSKTGGEHSINENITKDGKTILCEWHNTPLVDQEGKVIGVTSLVEDITDRQKQEDNARQTQKMDAIGKLTGGIAHDFNNMLGVILGFSEILKQRLIDKDVNLVKYCDEVMHAGERAKKLTSKLLEFSRIAPSSSEITDVNELLGGMQHMLERTLTPRIKLEFELDDDIWPVWLDKTRLEDAILNIGINSMHAMPESGSLTLQTSNRHLSKLDIYDLDITPGDYVVLSISDTGSGMTPEVQQKIFDPFFTTKGTEGTGLGLSQVYGFVQQSGGNIQVHSVPDHGTRITLYIPRNETKATVGSTEKTPPDTNANNASGSSSVQETILVVEDEIALLDLNEEILSSNGYTVLRAENATQALKILENNPVNLLLCDVIMPGIDGYQLAAKVEKKYPSVKIQMVSGFSQIRSPGQAKNTLHKQRLYKPLNSKDLLERVKQLLSNQ